MTDASHIFIPVLAGILINAQGKIFLARRKPYLKNGGKWEFPGGKLRPGEQPAHCLQRELQEEFGVDATVYEIFDVATHTMENQTILLIAYWAKFQETPQKSTDHDVFRWVSPQQLLNYDLTPADIALAQKLQTRPFPGH